MKQISLQKLSNCFFCFLALVLTLTSCRPKYSDFFPCDDSGLPKPCVAFMPIKDISRHELPWDVATEIQHGVRETSKSHGYVYFVPEEQVFKVDKQLGNLDLMSKDSNYFSTFKGCDYIVMTELVEHKELPFIGKRMPLYLSNEYVSPEDLSLLSMKVVLKVVDIREKRPRLIAQEVVSSSLVIPSGKKGEDYKKIQYGTKDYQVTFMKQAHDILIRDVRERIEQLTYAKAV